MFSRRSEPAKEPVEPIVQLGTLAPKFDELAHRFYVTQLEAAIEDGRNRSIALSGSYGVGKSSVLERFSLDHSDDVVEISFSGFRPDPDLRPKKAVADGETVNPAANSLTNQMQKEIVKQLIYREAPANTPASKYRRPEVLQVRREFALAGLIGALGALITYLTGFLDRPIALLNVIPGAPVIVGGVGAVAIAAIVLGLRVLLHNRVIIEKLSAGPATIALSPQATTFFDEYLDEIVYVFQVSGRRLVIFEDLDRFDDQGIFQALGALNTLLNRSAQLVKKPVVFVYAVRDSIFSEAANSDNEDAAARMVERADRTKFFDLIIPMVPFVSSKNARDLMMAEIVRRKFPISAELVDLSAQHVADMRLMLNVLNEFGIFEEILIKQGRGAPGLTADKLFALILYKNVHLEDFERARLGTSQLDDLYDEYRRFIEAATTRMVHTARRQEVRRVQAERRDQVAEQLGDSLSTYVRVTARSLGHAPTWTNTYEFGGEEIHESRLWSASTWSRVAIENLGFEVTLGDGKANVELSLSAEDLREITRDGLIGADWAPVDDEELKRQRDEASKEAGELSHFTMEQLYGRSDISVPTDPNDETSDSISFKSVVERTLKSRLARSLVREGHLDEYFAIYAAQFHGNRVSDAAQNFIMRHVDRGIPNALYPLTPEEASSVIRERPEVLGESTALNLSIVDHLIASEVEVSPLLRRLGDGSDASREFLQVYLDSGGERLRLASLLGKAWPGALPFLVVDLETDEDTRQELVNAAARTLDGNYPTDKKVGTYLEANLSKLPVLSSEGVGDRVAIGELVRSLGVRFSDLSRLAAPIRDQIISDGSYELTASNLEAATGAKDLSLDSLSRVPSAFEMALGSVGPYLAIVEASTETPAAINSANTLVAALVALKNREDIDAIVGAASPAIRVDDIARVPVDCWGPLADRKLVAPTAANVIAFVAEMGELSDGMAKIIRGRRSIENAAELTAVQQKALALAVLDAEPISTVERSRIAKNLLGGAVLAATEVPHKAGDLFSWMVRRSVIPDDVETFELTAPLGWATREALINGSKQFTSYITPALLTGVEVRQLLDSKLVSITKKAVVLGDVAAFTKGLVPSTLWMVARVAFNRRRAMTSAEVLALASRGMSAYWTMVALAMSINGRTLSEVTAVLTALGGRYAEVGVRNKRPTLPNDDWHRMVMDYLVAQKYIKAHKPAWFDNEKMTVLPV